MGAFMDALLLIIFIPIFLLVGVIIISDGECYYCGERLKKPITRLKGKKHCGKCEVNNA